MSRFDQPINAVSVALLKHAGLDDTRARAVRYEHRVGELPVLIVEYVAVYPDPFSIEEPETETVVYEWRQRGTTRTIHAGTPEFDAWIASLPRAEDMP